MKRITSIILMIGMLMGAVSVSAASTESIVSLLAENPGDLSTMVYMDGGSCYSKLIMWLQRPAIINYDFNAFFVDCMLHKYRIENIKKTVGAEEYGVMIHGAKIIF